MAVESLENALDVASAGSSQDVVHAFGKVRDGFRRQDVLLDNLEEPLPQHVAPCHSAIHADRGPPVLVEGADVAPVSSGRVMGAALGAPQEPGEEVGMASGTAALSS